MKARFAYLLMPVGLIFALLPGCSKEYPESLQYGFTPFPIKTTKTITIKRVSPSQVVELDEAGNPKADSVVSPAVLEAFAVGLEVGQTKGVGVEDRDVFDVDAAVRSQVAELINPIFGTPRHPTVAIDDEALVSDPELQLNPEQLARGSLLYRRHCLHCHGLAGAADGTTAKFLNPRPRDFRQAKFKFRSTVFVDADTKKPDTAKYVAPAREDLIRTLQRGVPTASMPAFNLLSDEDLNALVSYVIHLSIRGRVEYEVARSLKSDPGSPPEASELALKEVQTWVNGVPRKTRQKQVFDPPSPAFAWGSHADQSAWQQRLERGKKVYEDAGGCVECHARDGRASVDELATNLNRRNDWGDVNTPRNLTQGVYRGGARPVDLYWRIKLGIAGSGMPAAADKVTDEDVWYLVNYVMTLPKQQR